MQSLQRTTGERERFREREREREKNFRNNRANTKFLFLKRDIICDEEIRRKNSKMACV